MTRVAADDLRQFAAACYAAVGVPAASAQRLADTLVQAELWGHPSHGVMRLFWYADRLQSGATSLAVPTAAEAPPPAFATLDGANGIGQVVAHAAMQRAIAAAKAHGIGAVSVRNSGHFGTAMYFTRMAARAGCVGFLSTNASPAMAPWGGREKRVGTNPWSWAAPAGRYPPLMLDIANTAVARGKLYAAAANNEAIPEGWAIDTDGTATTDPAAGIAGTILPMAGHKGYAIAMVMDMLSGVLSGSAFGAGVVGPYVPDGTSGAGHLALAIDIAASRPVAEFEADMESLIDQLKATPTADAAAEILYPGELEAQNERQRLETGIELPPDVMQELRTRAQSLGVAPPF